MGQGTHYYLTYLSPPVNRHIIALVHKKFSGDVLHMLSTIIACSPIAIS